MKIYFDTCSLQRPLDDKSQSRIALEAEAVLGLLARCTEGKDSLVASEILALENARNSHSQRRAFVDEVLRDASFAIKITEEIRNRANVLQERGFDAFDALHVASAEAGKVDWFCTCDDRLLKKIRRQKDVTIRAVSPLELANEVFP